MNQIVLDQDAPTDDVELDGTKRTVTWDDLNNPPDTGLVIQIPATPFNETRDRANPTFELTSCTSTLAYSGTLTIVPATG